MQKPFKPVDKIFLLLLYFLFTGVLPVFSQSTNVPHTAEYYHLLDRYEIKSGRFSRQFHTGFKAVHRKAVAEFAETRIDSIRLKAVMGNPLPHISGVDAFNLQFMANDQWEWTGAASVERRPLLGYFYRHAPDLFSVDRPDLDLHVNPVLLLQGGMERDGLSTYANTRGIEIRGMINRRLGFYSFMAENQARYPAFVRDHISSRKVVPAEGPWKEYKEEAVDFFTAIGYVSFNATRHINFQLGQDRFFIGNGRRSMILSDIGSTYPFLKIQTQLWRFSYTNLFAQLRGDTYAHRPGSPAGYFPKKFLAMHHLSLNVTDNFNIGLFEAIVSGDSLQSGLEVEYLNPVIFYRAAEHYTGSVTGNAMVGADVKWNFLQHFQLYGQFVLDEFHLGYLRDSQGWWANKWASQLGFKYIDVLGLLNLDLQWEWNRSRPFMYAHKSDYTNYTHFSQPLAHPLGANFDEHLLALRYQPLDRLSLELQYLHAHYGSDSTETSYGGDIFKSYQDREQEFGHYIGQGIPNQLRLGQMTASYMLAHRLYIDFSYTYRRHSSAPSAISSTHISTAGLRWNIGRREHLF